MAYSIQLQYNSVLAFCLSHARSSTTKVIIIVRVETRQEMLLIDRVTKHFLEFFLLCIFLPDLFYNALM